MGGIISSIGHDIAQIFGGHSSSSSHTSSSQHSTAKPATHPAAPATTQTSTYNPQDHVTFSPLVYHPNSQQGAIHADLIGYYSKSVGESGQTV